MRKLFLTTTVLFLVDAMLQVYLAAFGTFLGESDETAFSAHAINGQIVLRVLALLVIVFAALAKAGKGTIWLAVTVFLLTWVQMLIFIITGVIFGLGPDSHAAPPLAAVLTVSLHGLNGSLIIVFAVMLVFRARALVRGAATPPAVGAANAMPAAEPTNAA